jgi:hypothetical protein
MKTLLAALLLISSSAFAVPNPTSIKANCILVQIGFDHTQGDDPSGPIVHGPRNFTDGNVVALDGLQPVELTLRSTLGKQFRIVLSGNGAPEGFVEMKDLPSGRLVEFLILQFKGARDGSFTSSQEFVTSEADFNFQLACKVGNLK